MVSFGSPLNLAPRLRSLAPVLLAITLCVTGVTSARSSHPTPFQEDRASTSPEITALTDQLKSPDEEQRRDAVLKLALLEDAAAVPALRAAADDRSERVRAAAITAIGDLGDTSSVPLLVARLAKDKSIFVRKAAAYALGRLKSHEGTVALVAALKDKNVEVRGTAAVALGEYKDGFAVPALRAALKDKSDFTRAQAARALGTNGRASAAAVPDLINLLTSDDAPEVKRESAEALGLIGDPSALPSLERARQSSDPYLSLVALTAIERIQDAGYRIQVR